MCSNKECAKDRKGKKAPEDHIPLNNPPPIDVECAGCGKMVHSSKTKHCKSKACKEAREKAARELRRGKQGLAVRDALEEGMREVEAVSMSDMIDGVLQKPPRVVVQAHEKILARVRKQMAKCVFDCICHRCGVVMFPSEVKWAILGNEASRASEIFSHMATADGNLPFVVREKAGFIRNDGGVLQVVRKVSCCYHCLVHPQEIIFDTFGPIPQTLIGKQSRSHPKRKKNKQKKKKYLSLFIIIFFFFFSCHRAEPAGNLPDRAWHPLLPYIPSSGSYVVLAPSGHHLRRRARLCQYVWNLTPGRAGCLGGRGQCSCERRAADS